MNAPRLPDPALETEIFAASDAQNEQGQTLPFAYLLKNSSLPPVAAVVLTQSGYPRVATESARAAKYPRRVRLR